MTDLRTTPPKWLIATASFAGILGVGVVDSVAGFDVSFSVFYALPVIFGVWFAGRWIGSLMTLIAVGIWALADLYSGHHYASQWIPVWNACVRFSFLMLIVHGAYYTRKQVQRTEARTAALEQALPVCTCCKRIRDEDGTWVDVETYVAEHLAALPEHKVCPDCSKQIYITKVAPQPVSNTAM